MQQWPNTLLLLLLLLLSPSTSLSPPLQHLVLDHEPIPEYHKHLIAPPLCVNTPTTTHTHTHTHTHSLSFSLSTQRNQTLTFVSVVECTLLLKKKCCPSDITLLQCCTVHEKGVSRIFYLFIFFPPPGSMNLSTGHLAPLRSTPDIIMAWQHVFIYIGLVLRRWTPAWGVRGASPPPSLSLLSPGQTAHRFLPCPGQNNRRFFFFFFLGGGGFVEGADRNQVMYEN